MKRRLKSDAAWAMIVVLTILGLTLGACEPEMPVAEAPPVAEQSNAAVAGVVEAPPVVEQSTVAVAEVAAYPGNADNPIGSGAGDAVRGSLNGFEYEIHSLHSVPTEDGAMFFAKVTNVGSNVFVISTFRLTAFDSAGNPIATDDFFTPGDIVPAGKTIPIYRPVEGVSAANPFEFSVVGTGPMIEDLDGQVVELAYQTDGGSAAGCETVTVTNIDDPPATHGSIFELFYNSQGEIVSYFRQSPMTPLEPGETSTHRCGSTLSSAHASTADVSSYEVIVTAYFQASHYNE